MWDSKAVLSEIQVRSIASLSQKLMWGSKALWSEIQVKSIASLSQELMWEQQGRIVRDTSQIHSQSKPTFDFVRQARAPAHIDLPAKAEEEDEDVGVLHILGKSEALEGLAERYGLIED